jgi:HK97 family phage major capsid protein
MTTGTPSRERAQQLRNLEETRRQACESILLEARGRGETTLSPGEAQRFAAAQADFEGISEHRKAYESELARVGEIPKLGSGTERRGNHVAPLDFDHEQLRHAHERLRSGEAIRLESRDFTTATPFLPAELAPYVTAPVHEGRILDHIPAIGIEAPSLEVIQIKSVTGTASTVAEGAVKAEIVPVTTPLTITAKKIAAHVGLSVEALADFDVFTNAVRIELQRQVIDCENEQILYGDGTGTNLNGFTTTAGIVTFDATTAAQGLDAVEEAITALRVGNALAVADLLVMHPTTWSGLRRIKDTLGRYLTTPDPTKDTADTLWGVDVVTTTVCHVGDGVLIDSTKFGRAVVREPLSLRIGWANDDLTRNILRTVAEQRLNLAVERPAAVCWIKNLPTAATTTAAETKARK